MRFDIICLAMEGSKIISGGVHSDFGYIGKIAHSCSHSSVVTVPPQPHLSLDPGNPATPQQQSKEIWVAVHNQSLIEGHTNEAHEKDEAH